MTRFCKKCQTDKSDVEFSPTANYCRACMAATKAQSRANKKAGIQTPRGRPGKPATPTPIAAVGPEPAIEAAPDAYSRLTELIDKALQGIDRSASLGDMIAYITRVLSVRDPHPEPEKPPVAKPTTTFKLDDNDYYICINNEKRIAAEAVQGNKMKAYLSSLEPAEAAEWEMQLQGADVYHIMDKLIRQRGYNIPHPFPPKPPTAAPISVPVMDPYPGPRRRFDDDEVVIMTCKGRLMYSVQEYSKVKSLGYDKCPLVRIGGYQRGLIETLKSHGCTREQPDVVIGGHCGPFNDDDMVIVCYDEKWMYVLQKYSMAKSLGFDKCPLYRIHRYTEETVEALKENHYEEVHEDILSLLMVEV